MLHTTVCRDAIRARPPTAATRGGLLAIITILPGLQAVALVLALGQDVTRPEGLAAAVVLTATAATLAVLALVLAARSNRTDWSDAAETTAHAASNAANGAHGKDGPGAVSGHLPARPAVEILALKAANDEAGRANESDAWAALIHQIHHELRTPLNAVIGFTDLMQREPFGPLGSPRYREYLSHIQQSGELLLKSAEDTLAMTNALAARREAGAARERTTIAQLAEAAWRHLPLDPAQIGFHLTVIGAHAEIEGDETALRQVFSNLFCEAISRSDVSGAVTCTAHIDQDFVRVEVKSHGCLAHGNTPAASLDVCIARTLLELHGAGLIVVARPGEPWRAVTVLDHAAQKDFFATPEDSGAVTDLTTQARAMTA